MITSYLDLVSSSRKLHIKQAWEGFEIVLGWETRNKYRIHDEQGRPVAFAAEHGSGFGAAVLRQMLGHWRPFKVVVFNEMRLPMMEFDFPFRWFFKTLFVSTAEGKKLGSLQQRFGILYKKFDLQGAHGEVLATVRSPLWKVWTFEVEQHGRKIGTIKKTWAGLLGEMFTDKDNFEVSFEDPNLTAEMKTLMLAMSLMVDIVYFENNQKRN